MLALLRAISLLPGFERELRLLPMLVRAGQTCVDIGSSYGMYTIPLAWLVGSAGRVLAFEPRPEAAERLVRIARLLGLGNLQVDTTALGESSGTDTLVLPVRGQRVVPGRAYLGERAVEPALDEGLSVGRCIDVAVETLDDVHARVGTPIDFIKCDVEGSELDVLRGAVQVLGDDRPIVLCEVEERHAVRYGHSCASLFEFFAKLDYLPVPETALPPLRNRLFVPTERVPLPELRW